MNADNKNNDNKEQDKTQDIEKIAKTKHKFIRKQDQDEFWNQQATCLI